jgi:hypothetical protein
VKSPVFAVLVHSALAEAMPAPARFEQPPPIELKLPPASFRSPPLTELNLPLARLCWPPPIEE